MEEKPGKVSEALRTMSQVNNNVDNVHDQLLCEMQLQRLNSVWAKIEIVFGLLATIIGLLVSQRGMAVWPDEVSGLLVAGILLFVLGGYLALAGHRSHLCQSNNRLAAYLICKQRETEYLSEQAVPDEIVREA